MNQWWLATRFGFHPRDYYQYRLYLPERRGREGQYVSQTLNLELLHEFCLPHDPIWDKRNFFHRCRQVGLPTVPLIASFDRGEMKIYDASLWQNDLVVKPSRGSRGKGVRLWACLGDRGYAVERDILSLHEVIQRLTTQSKDRALIVQPRETNHAAIKEISNGALCTARLTTSTDPNGNIHQILPTFRMPCGQSCVDNFFQGNLVASIGLASGKLAKVFHRSPDGIVQPVQQHPDTGTTISGTQLPFWKRTVNLAERAQRLFPEFKFIGWDIAFTERGPVLVEGNILFGTEAMQVAHDTPLGETVYPRHLSNYLQQKLSH